MAGTWMSQCVRWLGGLFLCLAFLAGFLSGNNQTPPLLDQGSVVAAVTQPGPSQPDAVQDPSPEGVLASNGTDLAEGVESAAHSRASTDAANVQLAPEAAPDIEELKQQRFVVMDARAEMASMSRYCLAYAILVANYTGRTFVVPSFAKGKFADPDATSQDAAFLWDLRGSVHGMPFVRMRHFLAAFPLAKTGGRWEPQAGSNFTIQEVWPNPHTKENDFANLNRNSSADVLLIREDKRTSMCFRFKCSRTPERAKLVTALRRPAAWISVYVRKIVAETLYDERFAVVHWRSMGDDIVATIMDQKGYHLSPSEQRKRHQQCAHDLAKGVDQLKKLVQLENIVFFSDIHAGCKRGVCGYTEFEQYFNKFPILKGDRTAALTFLERQGWIDGDDLVARYLLSNPVSVNSHRDQGILGALVQEMSIEAPVFMTCVHDDCGKCARHQSGFSKDIVNARSKASDTKCRSFGSWNNPERHRICKAQPISSCKR